MKNLINKVIAPLGLEVHGKGYMKKIMKNEFKKDPFQTQYEITGGKAKVIFDVGANRGQTTRKYLELFSDAVIHSFEPIHNFMQYYDGYKSNKRVVFNPIGLSDKEGEVEFFLNKSLDTSSILASAKINANSDDSCKTVSKISIKTISIDQYCERNKIDAIDILKLDVQGAELAILQGAQRMLAENKIGVIYTESYFKQQYLNQPLFYDIAKYLNSFGFFLEDIYEPYYNHNLLLWCDSIFVKEKT